MLVWLIGLSGAGKTTIALELQKILRATNHTCVMLDGDIVREVCGSDLGHTLEDRRKNALRLRNFGKFLVEQKVNVIVSILSLFPEDRSWNRTNIKDYYEVFVDAELKDIERIDIKGIYKKARAGELSHVAGIDLPFPIPESPDLIIKNTFDESAEKYARRIFQSIEQRLI